MRSSLGGAAGARREHSRRRSRRAEHLDELIADHGSQHGLVAVSRDSVASIQLLRLRRASSARPDFSFLMVADAYDACRRSKVARADIILDGTILTEINDSSGAGAAS